MTTTPTRFRYETASGYERISTLELNWELNGDPITDNYSPDEITAVELWWKWVERYGDEFEAPISWYIQSRPTGTLEFAPFGPPAPYATKNFLTHWSWPADETTGEPVKFSALPVVDKLWHPRQGRRPQRADKGGFIQEATGWKPSAFQRTVHWPSLLLAANMYDEDRWYNELSR